MTEKPPVELWSLRILVEVAASRSMTLAASRLGVTQSAVSQAVRRLERDMGATLVQRGKRPVVLTQAGALLRERAEALLRDAARLPHALLDAGRTPVQEIRLGLVDTFASTAGPGLILALTGEATRVVVWSGLAPSLGVALVARDVDAIVTSDALEDVDGLVRLLLWKEPFVLLVPKALQAKAARLSLEQLAAERQMIRYSARSHAGIQVDRHLRRIGLATERRIEVDGSDTLVAMVAAGVGWAVATPLCLLQGAAHAASVHALQLPAPRFSRTLSLIYRQDGPAALAARVASASKDVLRRVCLRRLRALAPTVAPLVAIPERGTGLGDPSWDQG